MKRYVHLMILGIIINVGLPESSLGKILVVNCIPNGGYATIQAAINASVDGDTVLVKACIYQEAVDLTDKDILLTSEPIGVGSPATTIIEGIVGDDHAVIRIVDTTITTTNAHIFGFTIRNETEGELLHGLWYRGGIYFDLHTGGEPIVENNIIENNFAELGGGLYVEFGNSTPQIINNIIRNND